jgi:hypothetical protein
MWSPTAPRRGASPTPWGCDHQIASTRYRHGRGAPRGHRPVGQESAMRVTSARRGRAGRGCGVDGGQGLDGQPQVVAAGKRSVSRVGWMRWEHPQRPTEIPTRYVHVRRGHPVQRRLPFFVVPLPGSGRVRSDDPRLGSWPAGRGCVGLQAACQADGRSPREDLAGDTGGPARCVVRDRDGGAAGGLVAARSPWAAWPSR